MKAHCRCRSLPWIILLSSEGSLWEKLPAVSIKEGQKIALMQADGTIKKSKVKELYVFGSG